jgi:aldehyde:ferredoxin oxidoreductase
MDVYGFAGKILYVNLSTGDTCEEALDREVARKFVGDFGINTRLAYDLIEPGVEPLSPWNVIIIGAGPLTGTSAPSSSRVSAMTKLPLTNTVMNSNGGMGFSSRLKYAGYDHVIIAGRADRPVYLKIFDGNVEICDASHLWGKDTFQTTDELWKEYGMSCGVIAIGQAGENLVKISLSLVNKSATLGQYGFGAVMGSKNLKAIVANGGMGVKVADRRGFRTLSNRVTAEMRNWSGWRKYIELGHFQADFENILRLSPVRNYYKEMIDPREAVSLFGPEVYLAKWKKRRVACPSCPIGCRDVLEAKEGRFKGMRSHGQGIHHFVGVYLNLKCYDEVFRIMDLLQRYGISRNDFLNEVMFCRDLYERGIITKEDARGVEFTTGFDANSDLIKKVAFKEGIGGVLAGGLSGIASEFAKINDKVCERYGLFIKGAPDIGDPRFARLGGMQFDRIVGPAGPTSGKGGMLNPGKFNPDASVAEFKEAGERQLGICGDAWDRIFDTYKVNIGRLTRHTQDLFAILSCLGICQRVHIAQFYSLRTLAELYTAATGIEMNSSELKKAGERVYNLWKLLNVREGFSGKDDMIPSRWFEAISGKIEGEDVTYRITDFYKTRVLTRDDVRELIKDYYGERGWDVEKGLPTREKLAELGLEQFADALGPRE